MLRLNGVLIDVSSYTAALAALGGTGDDELSERR
jgi:hypothetical protein